MTKAEITCPLCAGTKLSGDHPCPECRGTGTVPNVFRELRHGRPETDEETAEAENRPLEEVREARERAHKWIHADPATRPEYADEIEP